MKKSILFIAVVFATIGSGCMSHRLVEKTTFLAVDSTALAEDAENPGRFYTVYDTLVVTKKLVLNPRGGKLSYKVERKAEK